MRLPTSLSLSRLEVLYIQDCHPKLQMRCLKESGEDWPVIAHIPNFYIENTDEGIYGSFLTSYVNNIIEFYFGENKSNPIF